MFTGIVEAIGKVLEITPDQSNTHFKIESPISHELKIDQSISHNGVCLTVTKVESNHHYVTAVAETLNKSNLNSLQAGSIVNLERCMKADGRFDGHIVQGHVDQTAVCESVTDQNGSYHFHFSFDPGQNTLVVEKGSICVNGVSLTCFNVSANSFEVAIIPFTWEHTNFKELKKGDRVNLEFDILGKYIKALIEKR
jgi:riboflavin synthase